MANATATIQAQDNSICQAIKDNVPPCGNMMKKERREMAAGMRAEPSGMAVKCEQMAIKKKKKGDGGSEERGN